MTNKNSKLIIRNTETRIAGLDILTFLTVTLHFDF